MATGFPFSGKVGPISELSDHHPKRSGDDHSKSTIYYSPLSSGCARGGSRVIPPTFECEYSDPYDQRESYQKYKIITLPLYTL